MQSNEIGSWLTLQMQNLTRRAVGPAGAHQLDSKKLVTWGLEELGSTGSL